MRRIKLKQKTVLRCMVAAAAITAVVTLIIQGLRLPWNEEGALFALYGVAVGFTVAILCNMALLWAFKRKESGK